MTIKITVRVDERLFERFRRLAMLKYEKSFLKKAFNEAMKLWIKNNVIKTFTVSMEESEEIKKRVMETIKDENPLKAIIILYEIIEELISEITNELKKNEE